jgi:hypothetical protein
MKACGHTRAAAMGSHALYCSSTERIAAPEKKSGRPLDVKNFRLPAEDRPRLNPPTKNLND